MFCPNCKAEYREGFTKCSECDVALVSNLPAGESDSHVDVPRNSEGLELLWSGVSRALFDRIHDALGAANIFHKVMEKDFGLLPNLSQSVTFVWIDSRDRASSRSVLEKILVGWGGSEQEADLAPPDTGRMNPYGLGRKAYKPPERRDAPFESVSLIESDAPGEPVPDDIVDDFDAADATAGVWSGDNDEMAQNLRNCLRENGIACVIAPKGEATEILVLPQREARAKEIIREIIDATPPE
jgi:hypothetical protein